MREEPVPFRSRENLIHPDMPGENMPHERVSWKCEWPLKRYLVKQVKRFENIHEIFRKITKGYKM